MTSSQLKCFLLLFGLMIGGCIVNAQVKSIWSTTSGFKKQKKEINATNTRQVFQLDAEQFEKIIVGVPLRFTAPLLDQPTVIDLPYPNGEIEKFYLQEAPVLPASLARRFPGIRSFVAYGIEDPTAYARLAWSPHGLQGVILSAKSGTTYIDPIVKGEKDYQIYRKEATSLTALQCKVINNTDKEDHLSAQSRAVGDCMFRTYRIAVACTGEYSDYHGGTTADALAAINATLTRVNAVYEKELSLSLELVTNNTDIIYLDRSTDPFPSISPNGFF